MKNGRSLTELAQEIERQNTVKKDLIVDTRHLGINADNGLHIEVRDINETQPRYTLEIGDIAHTQIAQATGVPIPYYRRMMTSAPELLTDNINHWLKSEPKSRMVRTLDGRARAFLSDRYRRIDNMQIAETVLPIIGEIPDAQIESCEITESRLYIKVVNPRLTADVTVGDTVQSGIAISNSEVGLGCVKITPLVYRLVCTNGMIVNDAGRRQKHVGRTNEATDDYTIFESDTLIADEHAFMLKVRDTVKSVTDQVHFDRVVAMMREAKEARIVSNDVPKFVELAAKEYTLTQNEGKGVLDHLIRGGDLSLYGMANAVTRFSQDVESYDRATDLETIGYEVLSMSGSSWRRLNQLAAA